MFSDREKEILKVLGRKSMTLRSVSEEVFMHTHPSDRPFDMEISVGNSIRRIMLKCTHYKLTWQIIKRNRADKKTVFQKVEV